jgi:hypothetical protein
MTDDICRCRPAAGRVCDPCLASRQPAKPRITPAVARLDKPPQPAKAQKMRRQRQVQAWQRKAGRR